MKHLPVAILAGGLATRLRPISEEIPKALVELIGEPFIAHQLRLLKSRGIERVVICAWYLGEMIRDFVGDGRQFGLDVEYSFDGSSPLGTGGAIKKALPLLGRQFFVLYGDSYLLCDYLAIQNYFLNLDQLGLMTVYLNDGQYDRSNVEFSANKILVYDKANVSPGMRHIDYGLGLFHSSAFERIPTARKFDLAYIYQDLLKEDQLAGYEVKERFYEIGSFKGIAELEQLLQDGSLDDE